MQATAPHDTANMDYYKPLDERRATDNKGVSFIFDNHFNTINE